MALTSSSRLHELSAINDAFASPELINDGEATAPSKRILRIYGGVYDKGRLWPPDRKPHRNRNPQERMPTLRGVAREVGSALKARKLRKRAQFEAQILRIGI